MDTKDINLGYVGFVPKGDWDSSVKYNRYNLVIHDYSVWYAKKDNVGAEPQEGSEAWGLMVDGSPIKKIEPLLESYVDVRAYKDCSVGVDGLQVDLEAGEMTRLYPTTKFCAPGGVSIVRASRLDTSKFTTFGTMFFYNKDLMTLDVSNWDTGNVRDMTNAFSYCVALRHLDVSGWDTSKVTGMDAMFSGCSSLQALDVSGWDTSKVTKMGSMFSGCPSLQTLDVSGWDTSKVTDMRSMFYKCSSLTTIIGTHSQVDVDTGRIAALKGTKVDIDLSGTTLERPSLLAVIKGLADLTGQTGQTLSLGSTLKAKLTSDDIAVATGKNWTVA